MPDEELKKWKTPHMKREGLMLGALALDNPRVDDSTSLSRSTCGMNFLPQPQIGRPSLTFAIPLSSPPAPT